MDLEQAEQRHQDVTQYMDAHVEEPSDTIPPTDHSTCDHQHDAHSSGHHVPNCVHGSNKAQQCQHSDGVGADLTVDSGSAPSIWSGCDGALSRSAPDWITDAAGHRHDAETLGVEYWDNDEADFTSEQCAKESKDVKTELVRSLVMLHKPATPEDGEEDDEEVEDWTIPNDVEGDDAEELEMVAAKVKDMIGKLSFAGKVWIRSKLRLATQNKAKLQALMDKEMEEHVQSGHRTKLVHNKKPCLGCLAGGMAPRYQAPGKASKARRVVTMNSDYIEYPGPLDNNGHDRAFHAVVYPEMVGAVHPSATKSAPATATRYLKAKRWIESQADPGDKQGYKIQRHHHDPGSEFRGETRAAMGEDNVQDTESGTDIHNTYIENANQLLQCTQAASCYSGISNQPNYDDLCQRICGESAKAARQALNHSQITQVQKDTGVTAIEQLTGVTRLSAEHLKDKPAFLEGGYVHIPKRLRKFKTSARMMPAVFSCYDDTKQGYSRVIPYIDNGTTIEVFPTVITNRWQREKGIFPWKRESKQQDPVEGVMPPGGMQEALEQVIEPSEEPEYEIEEIVSKGCDDDGTVKYEATWKGFSADDTTFHTLEDLKECMELVEEFEANAHPVCGAIEIPWSEFEAGGPEALEAKLREEKAMFEPNFHSDKPRLKKLTDQQLSELTEQMKKKAMSMRYAFTRKRPTLEEAAEGKLGRLKVRIVAKDLKVRRRLPKTDTYSPTPPLEGFRMIIGYFDSDTEELWTADFHTAFLQADDWDEKKWIVVKLFDPQTREWTFYHMTGPVYGQQTGSHDWYDTGSDYLEKQMGFKESYNAPSTYFHPQKRIRISMHVDDPCIVFQKGDQCAKDREWFFSTLAKRFTIKQTQKLTRSSPIDYCSIRVQLNEQGEITLDNQTGGTQRGSSGPR